MVFAYIDLESFFSLALFYFSWAKSIGAAAESDGRKKAMTIVAICREGEDLLCLYSWRRPGILWGDGTVTAAREGLQTEGVGTLEDFSPAQQQWSE